MRRLSRGLFTLCATLSLLLCLGTAALWAIGPVTVGDYGNAWGGIRSGSEDRAVVAFRHAFAFRSAGGSLRFHWNYVRRPGDGLSIGSVYGDAEPNRLGFA